MNIVIKNQNARILDSLNIEIIKTLTGEFSIEEVGQQLINMYFKKVIVDITAVRNYYDINSVVTFLRGFEPDNVIVLLNDSEAINSHSFLAKLVESGYYNFTRNAAGINYLLDNPNNLGDVSQYLKVPVATNLNPTSVSGYASDDSDDDDGYAKRQKPSLMDNNARERSGKSNRNQKVIGIQNLTEHAGATTLAYMMIKQLRLNYYVKGIEMNKQDFIYFRDPDLAFCTKLDDFKLKLKDFAAADAVIIDLNGFDAAEFCDEILYLVDPGTLKLNKLIKKDSNVLSKVKDGKIVLNRSAIKNEELTDFEYETKFKVFFNLANFNDRKERVQIVDALLYNLGFNKQNPAGVGLFGVFGQN